MQCRGQCAIREQNKRVEVMPRVAVKHKMGWNGDYGGVEGEGGVNGGGWGTSERPYGRVEGE